METKLGRRSLIKSGIAILPALAILGLASAAARPLPSKACEGCADACFTTCKDGCDTSCTGNCTGDCSGSCKNTCSGNSQ
jgi:CXXX repeat radical SAM target protein